MTKTIFETENKIRNVSKAQQKTLILPIPATIRDLMNFKHGTHIKWEVCLNENEKYIKIYEKQD